MNPLTSLIDWRLASCVTQLLAWHLLVFNEDHLEKKRKSGLSCMHWMLKLYDHLNFKWSLTGDQSYLKRKKNHLCFSVLLFCLTLSTGVHLFFLTLLSHVSFHLSSAWIWYFCFCLMFAHFSYRNAVSFHISRTDLRCFGFFPHYPCACVVLFPTCRWRRRHTCSR